MIQFALMPRWAWGVIAALLLIAAACAGVLIYGSQREASGREDGKQLIRVEWQAAENAARERRAEDTRLRNRANAGVTDAINARARAADHSAALLRSESQRLHDLLAERDAAAGRDPAAPPNADEAAALRRVFRECSSRREEVARDAHSLRDQVTGLQDYITNVCRPSAEEVNQ